MVMGFVGSRRAFIALAAVTATGATSCSGAMPRDAQGTLDRATGGSLYVGVSENRPWVRIGPGGSVGGVEADLVRGYATDIHARIHWQRGAVSELARRMKNNELDLVIGGLTADTPWSDKISPTRPYRTTRAEDGSKQKLVIGVRPGENALQVSLERYLARQEGEL